MVVGTAQARPPSAPEIASISTFAMIVAVG